MRIAFIAVLISSSLVAGTPELRRWRDDSTRYEITQYTNVGENHHPYITVDPFIDDTTAVIVSNRTGRDQLYAMDLRTGVLRRMTDASELNGIDHRPALHRVWYKEGDRLKECDTRSFTVRDAATFPSGMRIITFSVTCDGRSVVFSADLSGQRPGGRSYGPFAIFRRSLTDTSLVKITPDLGFNISHVQANPVDPELVLYCWQWEAPGRAGLNGAAPIRMWWVRTDGSDGGAFPQPFGLHRTHELWTADGSAVTYAGDFRFGPHKGREVLGIQSIDGHINSLYDASVWHAHQSLARDHRHWCADLFDHDDRMLMLFRRETNGSLTATRLFRHASSWGSQSTHPHPRFSPDGRYILFSSDRTGSPQVYSVRVDLSYSSHDMEHQP